MKTADIHLHSGDLWDSDNDPYRVCRIMKEMGAMAVCLTQHGIASQIETFRKAADAYGLKFIPGIEAYYQPSDNAKARHLLLLAQDDTGWKAICRAITEGQNKDGFAVMTPGILEKNFGKGQEGHQHVIATSACISGVIAAVLRENEEKEKEIGKACLQRQKALKNLPGEDYFEMVRREGAAIEEELREANEELTRLKAVAGMKFKQREKSVAKMEGEAAKEAKALLEADRKAAGEAAARIPSVKENVSLLRKRLTENNKAVKQASALMEKGKIYTDRISQLEKMLLPEEELEQKAEIEFHHFIELFGRGNFYAEVQYHGIEEEKKLYPWIARLARKVGCPIVASNDVHTLTGAEDELLKRRILRSFRFEKWQEDSPGDDQLYIKTDEEMKEWLLRILPEDIVEEAMGNIPAIVNRCNVEFKVVPHYPKIQMEEGETSKSVFMRLIREGIQKLLPGNKFTEEYRKRLEYEIRVIEKMGFIDYHLVVYDFLDYARLYDSIPPEEIDNAPIDREELVKWKENRGFTKSVGMSTGVGRGSAGGSLVCYLLGITKIDPIRFDLLFERFLNEQRVSMPDIDSDMSRKVRQRAIEYVKGEYGEDCVCGIMTQQKFSPKNAVRYAAKAYGLYRFRNEKESGAKAYLSLGDRIAKKIPSEVGMTFGTDYGDNSGTLYQKLCEEFCEDETAMEILRWAKSIEGCLYSYGAHAAGVVITDGTPVREIIPLRWNESLGIYVAQCDMVEVEEKGMLKFDFLGLKTLDIITECLWILYKKGICVDLDTISFDVKEVFEKIFATGKTDSVFQFESAGMKNMLRRAVPKSLDDLIILVAMFRPGPLQYIDSVLDVKNGKKEMTFLIPQLEPILKETYAGIVYQEQIMRIFQDLAGYTLGDADIVRRAMSKKKMKVLEKERETFIFGDETHPGCRGNHIDTEKANILFDHMMDFAKYCFNKSHAAGYAVIAYITGWFKCRYPAEFLTAALNWAEKTNAKKDPYPGLMAEAESLGIKVSAPDINVSEARFTTDGRTIYFGLSSVKSVGMAADQIIEERRRNGSYHSFHEFFRRCPAKRDSVKSLISAGAFDRFNNGNRRAMEMAVDDLKKSADAIRGKQSFIRTAEIMSPYVDDLLTDESIVEKQKQLGLTVELKEPTTRQKLEKRIKNAAAALASLEEGFREIRIDRNIAEDKEEKLRKEYELLGLYVSGHPLDEYDDKAEGIEPISKVTENTRRILGYVKSVRVTKTKKGGSPIAFAEVEDRTGTIKVNFFTSVYPRFESIITQGQVLIIEGRFREEDVFGSEDEKEYVLTASEAKIAKKKMKAYLLSTKSYAIFHIFEEKQFRQKYEDSDGHPLLIYDGQMKELRTATYRISGRALEDKLVEPA